MKPKKPAKCACGCPSPSYLVHTPSGDVLACAVCAYTVAALRSELHRADAPTDPALTAIGERFDLAIASIRPIGG